MPTGSYWRERRRGEGEETHTEINAYRKLLEGEVRVKRDAYRDQCLQETTGGRRVTHATVTLMHTKFCMNADVKIDFRVSTL
jgi:hypothetical protein